MSAEKNAEEWPLGIWQPTEKQVSACLTAVIADAVCRNGFLSEEKAGEWIGFRVLLSGSAEKARKAFGPEGTPRKAVEARVRRWLRTWDGDTHVFEAAAELLEPELRKRIG